MRCMLKRWGFIPLLFHWKNREIWKMHQIATEMSTDRFIEKERESKKWDEIKPQMPIRRRFQMSPQKNRNYVQRSSWNRDPVVSICEIWNWCRLSMHSSKLTSNRLVSSGPRCPIHINIPGGQCVVWAQGISLQHLDSEGFGIPMDCRQDIW